MSNMSVKEFEKNKRYIKKQFQKLKVDVAVLNKMVQYVEEHYDDLTPETSEEWSKALDDMEDQLKIVELFG